MDHPVGYQNGDEDGVFFPPISRETDNFTLQEHQGIEEAVYEAPFSPTSLEFLNGLRSPPPFGPSRCPKGKLDCFCWMGGTTSADLHGEERRQELLKRMKWTTVDGSLNLEYMPSGWQEAERAARHERKCAVERRSLDLQRAAERAKQLAMKLRILWAAGWRMPQAAQNDYISISSASGAEDEIEDERDVHDEHECGELETDLETDESEEEREENGDLGVEGEGEEGNTVPAEDDEESWEESGEESEQESEEEGEEENDEESEEDVGGIGGEQGPEQSPTALPPLEGAATERSQEEARTEWCHCRQPDDGSTMIECNNGTECPIQWYHLACTGLRSVPSESTKWECRLCRGLDPFPRLPGAGDGKRARDDSDDEDDEGYEPGKGRSKPRKKARNEGSTRAEGRNKGKAVSLSTAARRQKRRREEDEDEEDEDEGKIERESLPAPKRSRVKPASEDVEEDGQTAVHTTGGQSPAPAQQSLAENNGDESEDDEPIQGRRQNRHHAKPSAWSEDEETKTIEIMRRLIQEGRVKGDKRWAETSRLLKQEHQIDRSAAAVKNQWNRFLRERSGVDERRGAAVNRPMRTGLQTPKTKKETQ
ncbi:MAG: hypothetical protein M1837_002831 [Sclerophora amabilis]|nr:MAG: hypothetical protein M1837_002831 [Sclerophora amabilis]